MPILKNKRYEEFEHALPMDLFRGVPLKGFPWLLDKKTHVTGAEQLVWNIEIWCRNATPSRFGNKLNLELEATATLATSTIQKLLVPRTSQPRIELLFEQNSFTIDDRLEQTKEGNLEDLPKFASALQEQFGKQIDSKWNHEYLRTLVLNKLKRTSPGGFGRNEMS